MLSLKQGTNFVRCIKPNSKMVGSSIEGDLVLTQLECSGTISVLELMAHGFPSRSPFNDLHSMYKQYLPPKLSALPPKTFCEVRSYKRGGSTIVTQLMGHIINICYNHTLDITVSLLIVPIYWTLLLVTISLGSCYVPIIIIIILKSYPLFVSNLLCFAAGKVASRNQLGNYYCALLCS